MGLTGLSFCWMLKSGLCVLLLNLLVWSDASNPPLGQPGDPHQPPPLPSFSGVQDHASEPVESELQDSDCPRGSQRWPCELVAALRGPAPAAAWTAHSEARTAQDGALLRLPPLVTSARLTLPAGLLSCSSSSLTPQPCLC